jgi:hypothetical protein
MSLRISAIILLAGLTLTGCASKPLQTFTKDSTPLMLVPAIQHEDQDQRGRFREIFCEILETRKSEIKHYRPCEEALVQVGPWPAGTGEPVDLGPAKRRLKVLFVPGVGWGCFSTWLSPEEAIPKHLQLFDYEMVTVDVNGLSGSEYNAAKIRNTIMEMPLPDSGPELVLVGYSKGAVDTLTALVDYPEIHDRVAAVISVAGAVGGSPLANDAGEEHLNLLQRFPGVTCKQQAGSALQDLRPGTRMAWLANNPLPDTIPFYSVITFPDPANISSAMRGSYRKLSRVDARNDGQLIYYDQFVPGSTLLAYLNADHWAVAPISRNLGAAGDLLLDKTDYPRGALLEALLRYVEEELDSRGSAQAERTGVASRYGHPAD